MSQVLSLRITDKMADRLERFARHLGNGMTRSKAGVLLLEEALREAEFAHIEFRDTILGRQAFLKGTGITVWEMIMIARGYDFDATHIAEDYRYSVNIVQTAFNYYKAYKEEIDLAIEDNNIDLEAMKRLLPGLRIHTAPKEEIAGEHHC